MLSDPLTVKGLLLPVHTTISANGNDSYATTDVAPGRSVRKCGTCLFGGPATLTISHSVSNDNKPAKTDRSLVRLDYLVKDIQGREMTAYAYAVFGAPRGAVNYNDPETSFDRTLLAQQLAGFICGITANLLDETRINRILAGEP